MERRTPCALHRPEPAGDAALVRRTGTQLQDLMFRQAFCRRRVSGALFFKGFLIQKVKARLPASLCFDSELTAENRLLVLHRELRRLRRSDCRQASCLRIFYELRQRTFEGNGEHVVHALGEVQLHCITQVLGDF